MIPIYLKAKDWQLFVLLVLAPLVYCFYVLYVIFAQADMEMHDDPSRIFIIFQEFPVIMAVFTCLFFGWLWSIVIGLQHKMPRNVNMNLSRFTIIFFIPLSYILLVLFTISGLYPALDFEAFVNSKFNIPILIELMNLISIVCIIHSMIFAAKTIKAVEAGRAVKFEEYASEFFSLLFSFVGIWIVQPKVNRLFKMRIPR